MAIFLQNPPPLTGAFNAGGVGKIAISDQYLASSRAVKDATGQVLSTQRRQTDYGKL